jgi:hypothetical protein
MIVFFCVIIDYAMDNGSQKTRTTSIAIVAIIAALALLGVVVTVITIPLQQAEARGCERGAQNYTAISASNGRCLGH